MAHSPQLALGIQYVWEELAKLKRKALTSELEALELSLLMLLMTTQTTLTVIKKNRNEQ